MSNSPIISELETEMIKKDTPEFDVGDTISVHQRIVEGEKERKQIFTGTVIARKGSGASETISLHRVAYGEGMERVFMLNSPRISKIEIVRRGDVSRSKLYYLRGTKGKAAKVKMRMHDTKKAAPKPKKVAKKPKPEPAPAPQPEKTEE